MTAADMAASTISAVVAAGSMLPSLIRSRIPMKPDTVGDDHEAPDLDPLATVSRPRPPPGCCPPWPWHGRRSGCASGGTRSPPAPTGPKGWWPNCRCRGDCCSTRMGKGGTSSVRAGMPPGGVAVTWWGLDGRNRRGAFRPSHLRLGVTGPDQHQAVEKEGHSQCDDQGRHAEPDGDQPVDQADDALRTRARMMAKPTGTPALQTSRRTMAPSGTPGLRRGRSRPVPA